MTLVAAAFAVWVFSVVAEYAHCRLPACCKAGRTTAGADCFRHCGSHSLGADSSRAWRIAGDPAGADSHCGNLRPRDQYALGGFSPDGA